MKAIIIAAGLGTRLKPLTDRTPKALVSLCGRPLIEHVILKLKDSGFTDIVVNVHHYGDQLIDFLEKNRYAGLDIRISDERENLLDTGGAVKKAAKLFSSSGPVLVHNVDVMSEYNLSELITTHCKSSVWATLAVAERETSRYLLFDSDNVLKGWKNKNTGELKTPFSNLDERDCRMFAFSGISVLSEEALEAMNAWEERFSIIDFYLTCCKYYPIKAYPYSSNLKWFDVGKPESLREAEAALNVGL